MTPTATLAALPVLGDMLDHGFMRDALLAGTAIAAASGLVGWFLVLRDQVFTGDALSHAALTGAAAALVLGVDLRLGLLVSVVAVALVMAGLGDRGRADDVVIGGVFAWVLGIGVLLLSVLARDGGGEGAESGVSVLFGSILGLGHGRAVTAVAVAAGVCAATLLMARPLLFASIDATVAAARGVPVRALGAGFLVLVALTAAEATQAVGALLLLALLAAPGAAARLLTDRPYRAMLLSAALAVGAVWVGLVVAYRAPSLPPSSTIVAALACTYAGAAVVARTRRSRAG